MVQEAQIAQVRTRQSRLQAKPLRARMGGSYIPANYALPSFERELEMQLEETRDNGKPLTMLWRKRIVKALYLDMMRYTKDMLVM